MPQEWDETRQLPGSFGGARAALWIRFVRILMICEDFSFFNPCFYRDSRLVEKWCVLSHANSESIDDSPMNNKGMRY